MTNAHEAKFINFDRLDQKMNKEISVHQTMVKSQLIEDLNDNKYFPNSDIQTLKNL